MRVELNSKASSEPVELPAGLLRERLRLAFGVGLASLLLYIACLAPTVTTGGDCGELIAASYYLGIAHPSGYPIYCLLGRLFAALVPFGEIAWRYNLFSAVVASIAMGLLTATIHRLLSRDTEREPLQVFWPSLGAGLLLTGFYFVGTQSLIAEVYALSALILALFFWSAVSWHFSRDWRWLFTLAFLFGVAFNSHLSAVFLVPGLFLYVIWQHRTDVFAPRALLPGRIAALGLCFLLSFSLTVYLPLRSNLFPTPPANVSWPLDWEHPATFSGWRDHVSAKQYKRLLTQPREVTIAGRQVTVPWFVQTPEQTRDRLKVWVQYVAMQFLWFTPLVIIGAWLCWRAPGDRWLGAFLLITFAFNFGVEIHYTVSDQSNFFFPAYFCMAIWMAFGLRAVLSGCLHLGERLAFTSGQAIWSWRLSTLGALAVLGTVLVQWLVFYGSASQRGFVRQRDISIERAAALEDLRAKTGKDPVSFVIMSDEAIWGFWYAHFMLHRAPHIWMPWGRYKDNGVEINIANRVAEWQPRGPVAISIWRDSVDARFPYEILTPSGSLCLASQRILPPPATPINAASFASAKSINLLSARFVRTPLSDLEPRTTLGELLQSGAKNEPVTLPASEQAALVKAGLPTLMRGALAAYNVDFRVTPQMLHTLPGTRVDTAHKAHHTGWIEVLVAQRGYLKQAPSPTQGNLEQGSLSLPGMRIFKQRRRLILPLNARTGQILRARVPLEIESAAPTGLYTVWTRLVFSTSDKTTPWQRTDTVGLVHI